jgi:hypothetical protein
MFKKHVKGLLLLILLTGGLSNAVPVMTTASAADGDPVDLSGQWYGNANSIFFTVGINIQVFLDQGLGYGIVNAPEGGLFDQPLPATFGSNSVTLGVGDLYFEGTLADNSISGTIWSGGFLIGTWQIYRELEGPLVPGSAPGPQCGLVPPIFCMAGPDGCKDLLPFDPDVGSGYIDYPLNGETWDNQHRSFARRDLMQLVKHAAAKVECNTEDWDYRDFAPIGLMDMSEADGSIPGTSTGYPGHPPGSHENGNDMDIAYYQLHGVENEPAVICRHFENFEEAYHCVEEPYDLDAWRTALFIAYLAKHPHVRVIGVDGQVGLLLEPAFEELVQLGWIDAADRDAIPLVYEVTDQGWGFFKFHHHHLHLSMSDVHDILADMELAPATLNRKSKGKYFTAHVEFDEGHDVNDVDLSSVMLVVDGHSMVPALAERASISDFNGNGIPDLTLKFDRQSVIESTGPGYVEIAITGTIDGAVFSDTGAITVHE